MDPITSAQMRLEIVRMFGDKMGYEGLKVIENYILEGTVPPPPVVAKPEKTKSNKKVK